MDLCRLTIHELRDLIQTGDVSPVQAVQSYLTRIDAVEKTVHAFNCVTAQAALDAAGRYRKLQADKAALPPLAGIPLAVKDVICTQGVPTTCSSRQKLGVKVERADASTPQGLNDVVGLARKNAEAHIVLREGLFQQQRSQIVELATKYRLPSMGTYSEFAETGGLISYGQNIRTNPRRAAAYVDKIFKGAKPSDLPVEQPMEFELVVNRKTAKAFGLTIPQSLLISATKIID